ncbi:MAG: HAMP domain-containing sensor histidine kinase [Pseudohongiellaceae bacterium]
MAKLLAKLVGRGDRNRQTLDTRLIIIEALVFLLPALILFYLIYQEEISFGTSEVLILAGVLTLVLGGLLIVRNIFVQLRKLHQLVTSVFPQQTTKERPVDAGRRDELDIMFSSFGDLVNRYEITNTELRQNTADLDAVHRLTRIADRTIDLEELLGAVLTTALEISGANAGAVYTVPSPRRVEQITDIGHLRRAEDVLNQVLARREPVLQDPDDDGQGLLGLPFMVRDELVAIVVLAADAMTLRIKMQPGQVFTLLVAEIGFAVHNALLLKNLEGAVADRTQELQQRNRDLEQEVQIRADTEKRLAIAKQQAESTNHAKSRFLANMGHELLTPLGVVIGFADVLMSESHGPLNAEQARFSRHILGGGRQLETLVQNVLMTVRLEADDIALDLQDCDAGAELTRALLLVRETAAAKSIGVEREIADDLPALRVDPGLLEKLFLCLLGNAIKFSSENSKVCVKARKISDRDLLSMTPDTLELTDKQKGTPEYLLIEVSDQGRGHDHTVSQKMFSLFEQGDNSRERNTGGAGLGLTMSQRIVALHQGFLWAESDGQGMGSAFFVALPGSYRQEAPRTHNGLQSTTPVLWDRERNTGEGIH